jgi:multiple sugar transport system permease protein
MAAVSSSVSRAPNRSWRLLRSQISGYTFLLPSLLFFLAFIVFPVGASFALAFTHWDLLTPPRFTGLQNYQYLFTKDMLFRKVLLNTIYYSVVSVPLGIACSLGLAVALNQKIRGVVIYRTLYFLPVVSSLIAVSIVWRWIYQGDWGLLNYLLSLVGIPRQNWLYDTVLAMPAVIFMSVWKGLGYNMVLFLAGLQGIPEVYYEAARIDGARRWKLFWHITLPLLSPVMLFVLIVAVINSSQVFGTIYIMTQAGPLNSTNVLVYYLYFTAFQNLQMGYAAAIGWVLFGFLFLFTMIQLKASKEWVHYGL